MAGSDCHVYSPVWLCEYCVLLWLSNLWIVQDLIADLKSELSGHFEDVVLGLMMTPAEYDASEVYKAIKVLLNYACVS